MAHCPAVLLSANRLFRDGIRGMLARSRITVVAEVRDISELVIRDGVTNPELVIIHLASDHAEDSSLGMIDDLRQHFPEAHLVVLADASLKSVLPNVVGANVSAILLTDISAEVLESSLELVLAGQRLFPADVMALVSCSIRPTAVAESGDGLTHLQGDILAPNLATSPPLSKREFEVVQCLAEGLSNKIIARELNITEGTVKVHIKALLRKLRVQNRTQLAIWALRQAPMPAGPVLQPEPSRNSAATGLA